MKFTSTVSDFEVSQFSEAILTSFCPDGGLLMPENLPMLTVEILRSWKNLKYPAMLTKFLQFIIGKSDPIYEYLEDIEKYAFKDFTDNTVVLKKLSNISVLELFHGPTFAFKDYAMFPLAFLIDKAIKIKSKNSNSKIIHKQNLLIATTGDTGCSALEAARDYPETLTVYVLFPKGRISEIQKRQMTTANTKNGFVIECPGSCDDLEQHIYAINDDKEFSSKYNISCLNSINCGRIICQIALHVYAYLQMDHCCTETVNIAIPCGGWGNLISACLAYTMNLPIRIILCNNQNDLGNIMIQDGFVEKQDESYHTLSSAMDTALPYNIERLLWLFSKQDSEFTKASMEKIERKEKVYITPSVYRKIRSAIVDSNTCSDDEILDTMSKCFREENYYICPHTASAVSYFYKKKTKDNNSNIAMSTASIEKFDESAKEAGIFEKSRKSPFMTELRRKEEKYYTMHYYEDPIPFLQKLIGSQNE